VGQVSPWNPDRGLTGDRPLVRPSTCPTVHMYTSLIVKSGAPHPYTFLHLSGGEKWGTSIYHPDDQKYGNSIHLSADQSGAPP